MKLSIIIPVYNERSTIEEVIDRVRAINLDTLGLEKEIIIIDDGSTDGTSEILERRKSDVTHVHFSRVNFGKGAAIRVGLTYVTGDFMIIQDADLELDPNDYPLLLEPLVRGEAQVVYGSRFLKQNPNICRLTRLANKFLTWLTRVLYGCRLTDMETGYKAFRADILKYLKLESLRFEFEPEVTAKVLKAGYSIHEVPISYNPRTEGKKIGWRDGWAAVKTLLKWRFKNL